MIGARIRGWREKRGVAVDVFADLCGMRKADICDIERDRRAPSPYEMRRITGALRIDDTTLREGPLVVRKGVPDEPDDF